MPRRVRQSSSALCVQRRGDPIADRLPVFEHRFPAIDLIQAPSDLVGPGLFDIVVRWTIQACDELLRDLGPLVVGELESLIENRSAARRHVSRLARSGSDHSQGSECAVAAVPLAPLDEQSILVAASQTSVAHIASLAALAGSSATDLTRLNRGVLGKAFCGELVPQDPNDEPAEVMLARVRGANGGLEFVGAVVTVKCG